jgi:hypothetical protein
MNNVEAALNRLAVKAYTNGWCHVASIALQKLYGGTIVADVFFNDDAESDDDFHVNHLAVRKPSGEWIDATGHLDHFGDSLDNSEVWEVDGEWIDEQVMRGELKPYTKQDVDDAVTILSRQLGM